MNSEVGTKPAGAVSQKVRRAPPPVHRDNGKEHGNYRDCRHYVRVILEFYSLEA